MLEKLKNYYEEVTVFIAFVFLSVVATYPFVLRFTTSLYAHPGPGDPSGTVWSFWWYKYAWLHRLSLYFCPIVAAPFGSSMPFQYPLWNYMVLGLSFLFNEVFTYNFLIFMSFPLSAFTMYLLTYHVTKNRIASVIVGLIFAFCPYHVIRAQAHLTLAHIEWMPLYLLSLFMFNENQNYRNAIFCAFCFVLVAVSDFYYGLFMLILTAVFLIFKVLHGLVESKRVKIDIKRIGLVLLAATLAATFLSAFNLGLFQHIGAPNVKERAHPLLEVIHFSARPWDYVVPPVTNPFFGRYTEPLIVAHLHESNTCEQTLYLGYVPLLLALAAVGCIWIRRKTEKVSKEKRFTVWFLVLGAFAALICSAQPFLTIGRSRIYFPSYFLHQFLPMFRSYSRFGIVVMMCVSVLAGIGLDCLSKRLSSNKTKTLLISFLVVILGVEFAFVPQVTPLGTRLPVYAWLAKQKGHITIAEYPMVRIDNVINYEYLFNQRVHSKKLVNGASLYTEAEEWRINLEDISKPEVPSLLSYLKVKYVVFHPRKYRELKIRAPSIPKSGLRLVRDFRDAQVYEVIASPARFFAVPDSNFDKLEKWGGKEEWRWMSNNGTLSVRNLSGQKINASLRFKAVSFQKPRLLKVLVDGNVVGSFKVSSSSHKVFEINDIEFEPGRSRILLHNSPDAQIIDTVLHDYDMREVSIAFNQLSLVPEN